MGVVYHAFDKQRGEEVALVTIVAAQGSTPQRVGAKMLVYPDGRIAEYFYQEFLPAEREGETAPVGAPAGAPKPPAEVKSQLF